MVSVIKSTLLTLCLASVIVWLFIFYRDPPSRLTTNEEPVLEKTDDQESETIVQIESEPLQIFIPPRFLNSLKAQSVEVSFENIGHQDIFQEVLAFNLYNAALIADIEIIGDIYDAKNCLLRDFFFNSLNGEEKRFVLENKHLFWSVVDQIAFDEHIIARTIYMRTMSIYEDGANENFGLNTPKSMVRDRIYNSQIVKKITLGATSSFLQNTFKKQKLMFVDELYPLRKLMNEHQHGYLEKCFVYCMKVTEILSKKGWKFQSFGSREENAERWSEYPWIEVINLGPPSYSKFLDFFKSHVFSFLHTPETFGMMNFESIQAGLPVITFIENAPQNTFEQMRNSVLCSLKQSEESCALMVEEFYESWNEDLFHAIREDAYEKYSAETFGQRLKFELE